MSYTLRTDKSIYQTERDLAETFSKWGVSAERYDVSYNVPRQMLERRTLSREERAVTVRWTPRGKTSPVVISMATQATVADNLRVLYLAVEAMRMNEKRGIDPELMRSAYMQLGAPDSNVWTLLGIPPTADRATIEAAYRDKIKAAHPDAGGSDEAAAALNAARDAALKGAS